MTTMVSIITMIGGFAMPFSLLLLPLAVDAFVAQLPPFTVTRGVDIKNVMTATANNNNEDPGTDALMAAMIDSTTNRRDLLLKSIPRVSAAIAGAAGAVAAAGSVSIPPAVAAAKKGAPDPSIYGPLTDLIGKWVGTKGYVMVAVPSPGTTPDTQESSAEKAGFKVLQFPYREEFVFSEVGDVLQRGGTIDQNSGVVQYAKTVWETETNTIIHKEDGMFFYLPKITNNDDKSPTDSSTFVAPYQIGRSAVVPHGNTAMMFGDVTESVGKPEIPHISTLPLPDLGGLYNLPFYSPSPAVEETPTKTLRDALDDGPDVKFVKKFVLDTSNNGGLVNTPFIVNRADTRRYSADFWIEDLGNGKLQMQYSETAHIFFHKTKNGKKAEEIDWPHVMVNTLTKV